ncbi:MAG: energy-coupling factor transporter transmembrane protein EcfT [Elainellaceae cyanobacterium]
MDLLRSLPIGLYIEQPLTWLHRIDARIKFLWLLGFLLTPIAATPAWRLALVALLLSLTLLARIPIRIWKRQIALLLVFSLALLVITALLPDGLTVGHEPRLPVQELSPLTAPAAEADASNRPNGSAEGGALPELLPQPTPYRFVLLDAGVVRITRRSLELAIRVSTLTFTLLYSSNLYLLTTAPEEITAGLENLMQPLRYFKVPVTEIALTLTLALRFIPLVLEEVQNLVRSISTRAINWKKLGVRGSIQVWLTVAERLLENLLLRAEQIASAMTVRGFTSPDTHQVRWHQFSLHWRDWFAFLGLAGLWLSRLMWG